MKFVKLHLDGFGKLVDRTFTFAPGLNLVFGPNEAGKSTLQQALLALLYGFFDEGSITKAKREFVRALVPWTSGIDFSGSLIYQLDSGQTLRIVRSFTRRSTTRLETYPEGQDAGTGYLAASYGRLYFADDQLGMGKGVFENTCVVRQAELVALEESAMAITDTLMRLSASASQDTTTSDALAVLDRTLRDEIGSDRARTKPLAKARRALEQLQKTQKESMKGRREAFSLIAELNQEEAQLEALDQDIERLRYLAALAEIQKLQAQLDASIQADTEAERLAEKVKRWQSWADFPSHLRDDVIKQGEERKRLTREIDQHTARMAEVRQSRSDLAVRVEAHEAEAAALADAKDVPKERLLEIQRLAGEWQSAQQVVQAAETGVERAGERLEQSKQELTEERKALGSIADLGPVGFAQLEQQWISAQERVERSQASLLEAEAEWHRAGLSDDQWQATREVAHQYEDGTYEGETRGGCRKILSRIKGPPGPPPEVAIYNQVKSIRQRWEAAASEARASEEDFEAIDIAARQHLGLDPTQEVKQTHFETAGQRLSRYSHLLSESGVRQQRLTDAIEEASAAREQAKADRDTLTQALETMGYSVTDLHTAIQTFEQDCARRDQHDSTMAGLQQLQDEDQRLEQEEQAQARREESLFQVRQSLSATLTQSGVEVPGDEIDAAVVLFEEGYENHQCWRRAHDKYEAALERPASGLSQQDREASRGGIASLKQQIGQWQATHPEWRDLTADRDAREYRTRSQENERTRRAKQERCTQLRESIQRMTRDLRHPAELAEEIAAAEAQVRRLEYLRDVLTLAKGELEAATEEYQRVFAPRLEEIIAEGMERVTQGRYTQASIDPGTLAVTLVAPERNEPVNAAVLSTGTRDLIYLLLRIGIGRLMSRTGEMLPILLDDPLVQFDRGRKQNALQFLADLTLETQILLFTKDDDILNWFRAELDGDEKHQLHILV